MRGNNQNKKRLDVLFAKVKQQEPLLSNEQVHNLISHASTNAFPGKQLVQFFNNHLKLIIMSTIVSSIAIGLLLLLPPKGNGSTQLQTNKPSVLKSEELVSVKPKSTKHVNYKEKKPSSADVKSEQIGIKSEGPVVPIVKQIPCDTLKEQHYGDEFILSLSFDEFSKLGLMNSPKMWYFYNHSPDSIVTGLHISKNGSWGSSDNSAVYLARKDLTPTAYDFYPVCVTNRYSTHKLSMLMQDIESFRSCLNCKPDHKLTKILDPRTKKDSVYIMLIEYPIKEEFLEWQNFELANDTLIPVTINVNYSDSLGEFNEMVKNQGHYAEKIYWFKPSESFYGRLPERYGKKIKKFNSEVKRLKENPCYTKENVVTYFSINRMNNTIESLPKLELTNNELTNIGINIFNDSLVYSHTDGSRTYNIQYSSKRSQIRIEPDFNESDSNYSISIPLKYISNYNGETDFRKLFDNPSKNSDLFFLENINRLIAVKIDRELCNKIWGEEMIFWFSPDKDFLNALPDRYKDEIKAEYKSLLIHSNPNISQQVKDTTPKYCTYFEECRPTFPEIETLKIYPNPANDIVNIEFNLTTIDKIRIVLFDIEGKPVHILKDMEKLQAGFNAMELSLASFPSGIYILTLQNNNGSYKTRRIIIQ